MTVLLFDHCSYSRYRYCSSIEKESPPHHILVFFTYSKSWYKFCVRDFSLFVFALRSDGCLRRVLRSAHALLFAPYFTQGARTLHQRAVPNNNNKTKTKLCNQTAKNQHGSKCTTRAPLFAHEKRVPCKGGQWSRNWQSFKQKRLIGRKNRQNKNCYNRRGQS